MKVGACFIDMKKGFDYIPHLELLEKLKSEFQIDGKLLKILCSFLTHRTFSVKINEFTSEQFKLNVGSPQGSGISTILFNCYYNDVISTLINAN